MHTLHRHARLVAVRARHPHGASSALTNTPTSPPEHKVTPCYGCCCCCCCCSCRRCGRRRHCTIVTPTSWRCGRAPTRRLISPHQHAHLPTRAQGRAVLRLLLLLLLLLLPRLHSPIHPPEPTSRRATAAAAAAATAALAHPPQPSPRSRRATALTHGGVRPRGGSACPPRRAYAR